MKIHLDQDWIDRHVNRAADEEDPGGVMACSPEIMKAAEECAGREWDGTQEDAERILRYYFQHPFV